MWLLAQTYPVLLFYINSLVIIVLNRDLVISNIVLCIALKATTETNAVFFTVIYNIQKRQIIIGPFFMNYTIFRSETHFKERRTKTSNCLPIKFFSNITIRSTELVTILYESIRRKYKILCDYDESK